MFMEALTRVGPDNFLNLPLPSHVFIFLRSNKESMTDRGSNGILSYRDKREDAEVTTHHTSTVREGVKS